MFQLCNQNKRVDRRFIIQSAKLPTLHELYVRMEYFFLIFEMILKIERTLITRHRVFHLKRRATQLKYKWAAT